MPERQKENAELLVRRPTRKHAPSDKAQVLAKGLHGQILRKVALLTDHAHDDGSLPPFVLGDEVRSPDSEGEYVNGVASVRPDASQPLLTGLHEVGHHIATHVLGAAAVQRIQDAARNTLTWEKIITYAKKRDYWTNPEEVFCRAYAQLVAVRSQDLEVLAELDSVNRDPMECFTQWPSQEFEHIRKVMEQELKKIGWL